MADDNNTGIFLSSLSVCAYVCVSGVDFVLCRSPDFLSDGPKVLSPQSAQGVAGRQKGKLLV